MALDAAGRSNLANRISSWGQQRGVAQDPYLTELSNSLNQNRDLSAWSGIDPLAFLPHPEPKSGSLFMQISRYVSIARNVSVFFPVALTWEAVSKATSAFGEYTRINSTATVNFLEFWQDGYQTLSKFWTIGRVASLDFILVLLVIALSITASVFGVLGSNRNNNEVTEIEQERTEIAVAIKEALFIPAGSMSIGSVAVDLSPVESALQRLQENMDRLLGNLNNNIAAALAKPLPDFPPFPEIPRTDINPVLSELAQVKSELSGISSAITASSNRDQRNNDEIGARLASASEKLESASTALVAKQSEFQQATTSLDKSASALGELVPVISQLASTNNATSAPTFDFSQLDATISQIRSNVENISPTLKELDRKIEVSGDEVRLALAGLRGSFSALDNLRNTLAAISPTLDSAGGLGAQEELRQTVTEMRNALGTFQKSIGQFEIMINETLPSSISKATEGVSGLSSEMELVERSIKQSARTVQDDLQELQIALARALRRDQQ